MSDLPIDNPYLPANKQDIDDLPLEDEEIEIAGQLRARKNLYLEIIKDTIHNRLRNEITTLGEDDEWEIAYDIYNKLELKELA